MCVTPPPPPPPAHIYPRARSVLSIVCIVSLTCCGNLARQVPTNYLLLFLFTLSEGYLIGTVASYYSVKAVVLAVGMTAFITLGLTLFAFQV
jgi:FtsH-binding integral membrane protein